MKQFWDERFSIDEYLYGENPNSQFKDFIDKNKAGSILLPGEGEGRNAIYAATKKWEVSAIDQSVEGKRKADNLATRNAVNVEYVLGDVTKHPYKTETFDAIALVFLHLPAALRKEIHLHLLSLLKKGGKLFIIGFSKEQVQYNSGGPKDVEMLYSTMQMQEDFISLEITENKQVMCELHEGLGHRGLASLVLFEAIKR